MTDPVVEFAQESSVRIRAYRHGLFWRGVIVGLIIAAGLLALVFLLSCTPRATVPPDNQAAYDSLAHRATIRDLAHIESGLSTGYLRYDIVEFSRFVTHMKGDGVFGRVGAGITTGGERCIAVYLRNDGRVERLYYFAPIPDKLDWIGCVYDRRDDTVQQYGFDLGWW